MSPSNASPITEPRSAGAPAAAPATPPTSPSALPELLAPAGDWDCAKAAVENGADAIYFGLEKFNARMRAHNFTEADLPKLMEFLHRRGVKGYVTFNILVFENEMAQAEQYARTIIAAGVDAAIVQDVGICRLLRRLSPDFPIHVSTQMTVTSAAGIDFARELGCNLVVLARECSLKEIEKIQAAQSARASQSQIEGNQTPQTPNRQPGTATLQLPLEVFVHGALCVAYSGQCLTSEALGGRSANRGECAQACRMPYDLLSDGKLVPLGDRKYLLSPQDLAGLQALPELVRLGVASLKIEGRLKSPEYVANITRVYRSALDRLGPVAAGVPPGGPGIRNVPSLEPSLAAPDDKMPPSTAGETPAATGLASSHASRITHQAPTPQYEMEMAFSRGLYSGWFGGINNQQLVHGRFGKKRGVYLGQVTEVRRESVLLNLEGPLKPGDGVVFDAGRPEEKEEGGRVYEIRRPKVESRRKLDARGAKPNASDHSVVELFFGRGNIDFHRIQSGNRLWKTSDPELERHLRHSFEGETPRFQRPLFVEVHGLLHKPLTLIARDEQGHITRLDSSMLLAQAEKQPLTTDRLRDQLGRLGGTPFKLGELKNLLQGDLLLPISELNRLRREMVAQLDAQRAQPLRWSLKGAETSAEWGRQSKALHRETPHSALRNPQLNVLVRSLAQLQAVLEAGVETVYCDFEDPKKYREAVSLFRNSPRRTPQSAIFVAPPRIFKMGEDWILNQVRSAEADGYLVRNYDHLDFFAHDRRIGDFSLNVANRLTADHFKNKFGLERLTASYDLNFNQLEALLQAAPPDWFEVTIHQHMPMFHMEHCVFCAFLSNGTDFTNCGRPCDKHEVKLRDRVGAEHPVKADVGCRNTVFNALAQTGAEYVPKMQALGLRHFRLEFLNETPEALARTIAKYRQLLGGDISGTQLWRELKLFNQLGVTRGQIASK